mmetsp:Transcript_21504/g.54150  ORF Transcript_21504/g.54150 Transcript_21504/m.54150 type:complete len:360 (-) Transcript_21504:365-1444(-)
MSNKSNTESSSVNSKQSTSSKCTFTSRPRQSFGRMRNTPSQIIDEASACCSLSGEFSFLWRFVWRFSSVGDAGAEDPGEEACLRRVILFRARFARICTSCWNETSSLWGRGRCVACCFSDGTGRAPTLFVVRGDAAAAVVFDADGGSSSSSRISWLSRRRSTLQMARKGQGPFALCISIGRKKFFSLFLKRIHFTGKTSFCNSSKEDDVVAALLRATTSCWVNTSEEHAFADDAAFISHVWPTGDGWACGGPALPSVCVFAGRSGTMSAPRRAFPCSPSPSPSSRPRARESFESLLATSRNAVSSALRASAIFMSLRGGADEDEDPPCCPRPPAENICRTASAMFLSVVTGVSSPISSS